jgi:hypothetical protein
MSTFILRPLKTLRMLLTTMLGAQPVRWSKRHARRYFGGRARARRLSSGPNLAELAARHRLSDDRLLR